VAVGKRSSFTVASYPQPAARCIVAARHGGAGGAATTPAPPREHALGRLRLDRDPRGHAPERALAPGRARANIARDVGCTVRTVARKHSKGAAAGEVIATSPAGPAAAGSGTAVGFIVSSRSAPKYPEGKHGTR
jgi:hypothetical protein